MAWWCCFDVVKSGTSTGLVPKSLDFKNRYPTSSHKSGMNVHSTDTNTMSSMTSPIVTVTRIASFGASRLPCRFPFAQSSSWKPCGSGTLLAFYVDRRIGGHHVHSC